MNQKFKQQHKFLKHGKRHRKRGNYKDNRGLIPSRISIEKRSALASRRKGTGNIEENLIVGKNHKGGLLVMLDSASLVTTIDKINAKKTTTYKKADFKKNEK